MFINRFCKMAALQNKRALSLRYDKDLAKAIAIAEAVKFV